MRYVDEFRDEKICQRLAREISQIAGGTKITLMEVCGTHTMSIFRYGLKSLLPPNIGLLSGPGCPVCVTPNCDIDKIIAYARKGDSSRRGTIIATFGDMMRVPGSTSLLEKEKSYGQDVRIVYSVTDALKIAMELPRKNVIFMGIGFETTAPSIALSFQEAKKRNLKNYFVLSLHKLIPPAMKAILDSGDVEIDGFILPGHVATITGTMVYEFVSRDYGVPCCAAGFEPVDILQSILMLVKQIKNGEARVENQYTRSVKREGNLVAKSLLNEVFEPVDCEWRGMGIIPESGLKIRDKYSIFDVEKNIPVEVEPTRENPDCICGDILRGVKTPLDCNLFGKICTPENPIGPCMVSSEGTCAACYKYGLTKPLLANKLKRLLNL